VRRKMHLKTLGIAEHNESNWQVQFHEEFFPEFREFPVEVRLEIDALVEMLRVFGPQLGRPRVDTLNGSRHANMKELRFQAANGEWRVAFAFDLSRTAILLVGGNKATKSKKKFYRELIRVADRRFDRHQWELARGRKR